MDQSRITEFSLHLISNADQRHHPDNVISAFSTTTNTPLQFQYGTWTCGLRTISYPCRLVNLDDREQYGIEFSRNKRSLETEATMTVKTIKFPTQQGENYRQSRESVYSFPLNLEETNTSEKLASTLNRKFQKIKIHRYRQGQQILTAGARFIIHKMRNGRRVFQRVRLIQIGYLFSLSSDIEDFLTRLNSVLSFLIDSPGDGVIVFF